jgi:uncharacterized membrane protein YdjX (TVP38/TMEM64 family)
VPIIFVVAGFAVVPVMLLIAVTVGVFGPLLGGLLAFAGAMASAATSYAIGPQAARNMVRRIAGPRLNELSRRLGKRGLLAMLTVRLVPVRRTRSSISSRALPTSAGATIFSGPGWVYCRAWL